MEKRSFFKVGKCVKCGSQEVVVTNTQLAPNTGVCSRCDSKLFYSVANAQKERWLQGGPANPQFNRS
jgi:DNA-directed RNA polymerase subunit RPC12/RpoP